MTDITPTPITKKRSRKLAEDPVRTVVLDEAPVIDQEPAEEPTQATAKAGPRITIPGFDPDGRDGLMDYADAPALAEIGRHLIETCPEFSTLQGFRVAYLWKREGGKQNGVPKMGDAKPCNGFERYKLGADFVLWIAADHAQEAQLRPEDYERYIFHSLCHCGVKFDDRDESETPTRRPHDLEMFHEEYARYGAWRPELAQMRDVVQQTTLPLDEAVAFKARI
jgi:hypothetical protein